MLSEEDNAQSNCLDDDADSLVIDTARSFDKINDPSKQKRGSPLRMLSWVVDATKHPDDIAIGNIPELSKGKENRRQRLWMQAISAQKTLRPEQCQNLDIWQSIVGKHLMSCPTLHDNHQCSELSMCGENLSILLKSPLCSCCYSPSSSQRKSVNCDRKRFKNGFRDKKLDKETEFSSDQAAPMLMTSIKDACSGTTASYKSTNDRPHERKICIGPLFQAEVPEWTGKVSVSDSKWLGAKVWSPDHKTDFAMEPVRNRKNVICSCSLPGSVECFGFHIAENRMKLKQELGSAFYAWRFDSIGEEVSLRWTADEERRFVDITRSNRPCLGQCFWDDIYECFPQRTRKNLVNYYFNVFVVRRRRYQNRVTPKHIDSDDDNTEFGSCGGLFGLKAMDGPMSGSLSCILNEECGIGY